MKEARKSRRDLLRKLRIQEVLAVAEHDISYASTSVSNRRDAHLTQMDIFVYVV